MKSKQSKFHSFLESVTDVSISFVIAVITQLIIYPWFGVFIDLKAQLGIAAIFTVIAIIRKYVIRRLFNWFT